MKALGEIMKRFPHSIRALIVGKVGRGSAQSPLAILAAIMSFAVAFTIGTQAETAQTNRIAMRVGSDARLFHDKFFGRTIWVDLYYHGNGRCSPGKVSLAEVCGDSDYEEIQLMLPESLSSNWAWTKFITLGRSRDFERNAYAAMGGSERYIIFGAGVDWGGEFFGKDELPLLLGHELGHHACGHTVENGIDRSRAANWKRELEADEFAGAALRQSEKPKRARAGRLAGVPSYDEDDVLRWALITYSDRVGTDSHPPQHLRIAAVLKGFRSGVFPCSGAALVTVALPPSQLPFGQSDALEIVRAFYASLGSADGTRASLLVIPEKRAGSFGAAEITKFYGSLTEPLRLISVTSLADDKFRADYSYRARGRTCDGSAVVTITRREGLPLIAAIKALNNC